MSLIAYGGSKHVKVKVPLVQAAGVSLLNDLTFHKEKKKSKHKEEQAAVLPWEPKHMSIDFTKMPFGFPDPDHQLGDKIRSLLAYSLKVQRDEDDAQLAKDVSYHYNSGFVSAVITACINALGGRCEVVLGFRTIDKKSGPHIWCKVDHDFIIDNTYEKFRSSEDILWLENHLVESYRITRYSYPTKDEMTTDGKEFALISYMKILELFEKQPDKALTLGLNHEQLHLYYFSMIRFMWKKFGINVNAINPAIRHTCWHCGSLPAHAEDMLSDILSISSENTKYETWRSGLSITKQSKLPPGRFKHCYQCNVAVYCSKDCQRADWIDWHKFVCVSRVTEDSSCFEHTCNRSNSDLAEKKY